MKQTTWYEVQWGDTSKTFSTAGEAKFWLEANPSQKEGAKLVEVNQNETEVTIESILK